MTTLKVVLTVLHLIIAFGLIAVVLFQSSKARGLSGSIAGGAETFFGKNKGKTIDGLLAKITVVLAILFVVTSVSLSAISKSTSEAPVVNEEPSAVVESDSNVDSEDISLETEADAEVEADTDLDAE